MSGPGFTGTRLRLLLGVGLLVAATWFGGRMTAPAGESHMSGMMPADRPAGASEAPFEGEEGAARCRAMMASMGDLDRSMQSMMPRQRGDRMPGPDTHTTEIPTTGGD